VEEEKFMKTKLPAENKPPNEAVEEKVVEPSHSEGQIHDTDSSVPLLSKDVRHTFSESFRILAQNIEYLADKEGLQAILVMGAYPGDGRTTIVANLGISLAMKGYRVILIDADDQNPYLGKTVVPGRKPTHYWLRRALKYRGWTLNWVPDQEIILVAPDDPKQLEPNAIAQLLRSLKSTYDFILIDSPPCLGNADAFQLTPLVDGVIYVVRRRPQDIEAQRRVKSHLDSLNVNLLGVIYNEV
jgi:Mrp family chromosome partitioning ATPase